MADNLVRSGGAVQAVGGLVSADQTTITGDGTVENPLVAAGGGSISVLTDEVTLEGDGTLGDTIQLKAIQHDTTLSGFGTVASELTALPVKFSPARALFVAQSWPVGADATIFFTTISSALVVAATMTPTNVSQITAFVYPGTYTENVTVVSNVNLIGTASSATTITGNTSWLPGAGVNAPQTTATEQVALTNFNVTGAAANVFTYDSTGKTSGGVSLSTSECTFGTTTMTGRGIINGDNFLCHQGNFLRGTSTYTFTNMQGAATSIGVELVSCRLRALAFAGNTIARIEGGEQIAVAATFTALTGTANVSGTGLNFNNPITVASGCVFSASGCVLSTTLTVASGGTADVRGSNYSANSNLLGAGTINRSVWCQTTGSTSVGANAITFSPPYPNATGMNVTAQLVSGPGNAAMTITAKAGTGCTLTDSVGGNVWDLTVIHD